MANIIKIKRGLSDNIATAQLVEGELAITTDTHVLYVGNASGNAVEVKAAASGTVDKASRLAVARNIALSGDVNGDVDFDGSANVVITTALDNIEGLVAGTYPKVTVNAKGLVTAGASLQKSDLSGITFEITDIDGLEDALDAKANASEVYTKTEVNTELNKKVDKVTGKGLSTNDYTTAEKNKLNGIEAGAQVNKIETVKLNGTALEISNKTVDVVIPAAAEYTVVKAATAETGYLATYNLTKDGTAVGASINIPKDFLVKSASVKKGSECVPAQTPADHLFIDFVINTKEGSGSDEHIFIDVNDLVDVYTAGNGINIANNVVSAKVKSANGLSVDATDGIKLDAVTTSTNGAMLAADKEKLDDIEDEAQVNIIEKVQVDGADLTIANKTVNVVISGKVDKVTGKSLVDDTEITKLATVSTGANKVENSTTNGNIKIDGTETVVYTPAAGTVVDADYKHITVTSSSVSDGTTTFNKYQHPTTTAVTAAAVKVGKDNLGHVVLGSQLTLAELLDDATHRLVSDTEKTLWNTVSDKADAATTLEGYGITDAYTKDEADDTFALMEHEHVAEDITDLGALATKDEITKDDLNATFAATIIYNNTLIDGGTF